MKRTILASLLAGVVALGGVTATASQARADHDIAKVIIGASALAIIGSAIANSHDHRSRHYTTRTYHVYRPYGHRYETRRYDYRPSYRAPVRRVYERRDYRDGRYHVYRDSYSYR